MNKIYYNIYKNGSFYKRHWIVDNDPLYDTPKEHIKYFIKWLTLNYHAKFTYKKVKAIPVIE